MRGSKGSGWTLERCTDEAARYATRTEFFRGSPTAYTMSRKKSWLDAVCWHMGWPYETRTKWTRQKCLKEALRYQTRIEFRRRCNGGYQAVIRNGWTEAFTHMIELRPQKSAQ